MAGGRIITRKYFPPGFNYEREWKKIEVFAGFHLLMVEFF